jgi:hypothetical protein
LQVQTEIIIELAKIQSYLEILQKLPPANNKMQKLLDLGDALFDAFEAYYFEPIMRLASPLLNAVENVLEFVFG